LPTIISSFRRPVVHGRRVRSAAVLEIDARSARCEVAISARAQDVRQRRCRGTDDLL